MRGQVDQILREDDVFRIVYDFRTETRTRRTKMIRMMRREEMHPNGRKLQKRIRKYRPVYGYNSYEADKPWDVLVEGQGGSKGEMMSEQQLQISRELEREGSASLLKQPEMMSKETICESRPQIFLYSQSFPPFEFSA